MEDLGKDDVLDDRPTDLVTGDRNTVLKELLDRERGPGAGQLVLVLRDHDVARATTDVDRRDPKRRLRSIDTEELLHASAEGAAHFLEDEDHLRRERLVDEEERVELPRLRVVVG